MKITLYEMDVLHRWLWAELTDTGGRKRYTGFFNGDSGFTHKYGYGDVKGELLGGCPACEYVNTNCTRCPYDWPPNAYGESTCVGGGLWVLWDDAIEDEDIATAKKLAAKIRDLPLKPEYQKQLDEEMGK